VQGSTVDGTVASLVQAAQRGDRDAFAALIRRFERTALALAFGIVNCAEAAGDVTQEAFITAWKRLGDIDEPARFPGWLCQIVRNTAIDLRRKRLRQQRVAMGAAVSEVNTDDALGRHDTRSDIAEALERLDEMSRSVIVLRYYEGLASKEIAAVLGMTPAAVDMRLSRARQELREYLSAGVKA
jgi:RNA polymerase sigma-70 factor, ECF subfamily